MTSLLSDSCGFTTVRTMDREGDRVVTGYTQTTNQSVPFLRTWTQSVDSDEVRSMPRDFSGCRGLLD